MKLKTLIPAFGALLFASTASAQETNVAVPTDSVFILNSLLFLIGGFLVFWMAAGFSMLEAGLVRSKNVTMQLTKNMGLFGFACLAYYLVGYNLMYPLGTWATEGVISGIWGPAVLEAVGIDAAGADDYSYASTGSDFFFQLMFCAATASIVSGALAERIKLWPFLAFTIVLTGFIYPLQASWKWGGGFLDNMGFLDFAGSTVVHSVGGWAALAGALILGPRIGKYTKEGKTVPFMASNLPLATLGTFILWMGWFGFNGGSQLAMGSIGDVADISRIFANTNAAAAAGSIAALILTQILYKKPDLTMILNGALAGLVAITAEPLAPSPIAAICIGGIGAAVVIVGTSLLEKLKIDDVVGAIPVHLFAGIWGTLAVPITNKDTSFATQFLGTFSVVVFMFVASMIVWSILKATVGIRISDEAQKKGTDVSEIGVRAYAIRD